MRALVIINPIAGPGRRHAIGACVDLATTTLAAHGCAAEVRITEGPTDAERFARDGVAGGVDLVVAWGGDGTVNGAGTAVAHTPVPLAIIPGGSGNGLARDLGVPMDARAAFTIAATGADRVIDAGDLEGALFFNVAGIGLDAAIAGRLATAGHRRGLLGYVLATTAELRGYQACAYAIERAHDAADRPVDGISQRPALFIALANSSQYGNGARIAPRALLDDGQMEIVVVEPLSLWGIARQLGPFFRGTLKEGRGIVMRSAASLEVACSRPIPYHVDGEPRSGPERLHLRTHRGVVRVRVNR